MTDESKPIAKITPDFILDAFDYANKEPDDEQRAKLLKVVEVLSEHLDEDITLDE
jgi:hypothetical protein